MEHRFLLSKGFFPQVAACRFLHKHLQNILWILQGRVCVSSGTLRQAVGIRQSVPVVSGLVWEAASPKPNKEPRNRYEVPAPFY